MNKADIGLIGLAVMGQNLVLNMNDHGYAVAVYNRTGKKVDDFLNGPASGRETIMGTYSLQEFIGRIVLQMQMDNVQFQLQQTFL